LVAEKTVQKYKNNPIWLMTGKKLKYYSSSPFLCHQPFLAGQFVAGYFCSKDFKYEETGSHSGNKRTVK
jgi:hypothetical protein